VLVLNVRLRLLRAIRPIVSIDLETVLLGWRHLFVWLFFMS